MAGDTKAQQAVSKQKRGRAGLLGKSAGHIGQAFGLADKRAEMEGEQREREALQRNRHIACQGRGSRGGDCVLGCSRQAKRGSLGALL